MSTSLELIDSLKPEFQRVATHRFDRRSLFAGALRAAVVKSYDFARYSLANENRDNAFFLAPCLRGICEDLIAFTFLLRLSPSDRQRVMRAKVHLTIAESTKKQAAFFLSERPFQPVYQYSNVDALIEQEKRSLKAIGVRTGFWTNKQTFPRIQDMAYAVNLNAVYNFIYSATSDIVHFNPRILLRTGWGDDPNNVTFSIENFSAYYHDFCRIYGLFLFLREVQTFSRFLRLSKEARDVCAILNSKIESELRWPEAVTFEELNIKGPGSVVRLLIRAAHESGMDVT